MDFDLSEEQRLLKDSVDGLLNNSYDFDSRKKYGAEKGGWSKSVWSKLAEQGLLGLPFSEDDGGFGAGAVETMIVMEALGKALLLEPYLATVVLGGGFLRRGGSAEQKAAHIPGIIDGSKTFAFAQLEKNSRYDLNDVATSAKKKGDGWVIDGEKFVVLNGDSADTLVVTARTKGGQRDRAGIGVFLVPGNAKGVSKKGYPTQDGLHAADITFTGVEVGADAAIGDPENGLPLIEQVVDDARIAMCAEAVGAMDESLKSTVEYLKTRNQFGVPIGTFQVLQHRAADMFVARRAGAQHVDVRHHGGGFRRRQGARQRGRGGQGADRQVGKIRRPAGDPAAWRHRHDHGGQDRPLLQAPDHDREHLRRHRLPPPPRQRAGRAGVAATVIPHRASWPGLYPAIHVFRAALSQKQDVDARDKPRAMHRERQKEGTQCNPPRSISPARSPSSPARAAASAAPRPNCWQSSAPRW